SGSTRGRTQRAARIKTAECGKRVDALQQRPPGQDVRWLRQRVGSHILHLAHKSARVRPLAANATASLDQVTTMPGTAASPHLRPLAANATAALGQGTTMAGPPASPPLRRIPLPAVGVIAGASGHASLGCVTTIELKIPKISRPTGLTVTGNAPAYRATVES